MSNVPKKTASLFRKIMKSALTPPEDIPVSEWAEKYRRLSPESAAEPGSWRNKRTPYLVDVMNAFNDPKVRHIVMVAASQTGKTECENNLIGYIIDQDPGSILFVHPTTIDAKEFSRLRIAPMIRDCPTLRKKVADPKCRTSDNTILQKSYAGGILTLCGSGEAHALASKPIRYVFGDERDRWAASAGAEGDPWELAMARQTTFYNAKAVEVSTPTIKGASAIEAAYSTGTRERWKTQCPHCGEYNEIKWENIRYEYEERTVSGKPSYTVIDIKYFCPECGAISDEYTMKHQPARWEADDPDAYQTGTRSFWLNAFVSQWATWESIILKFLRAKGSAKKMQVVYNTCFGELWEDRGDLQDESTMIGRREDYGTRDDGSEVELPEGVLVLTCGVDTQDDRLEFEVVGHGHFGETWGIRKGILMGRPDDESTWSSLDDVLDHVYRFKDGTGLRISMTFIDEGGHFTQEVRLQARQRIGKKVFCIKGIAGQDRPYTGAPKQQRIMIQKRNFGTCWQYQIGVDSGKQIIMDNLRVESPGPKYCHFPLRDEYGEAYFTGLLSEHLVYHEGRRNPWGWEKIPGHERNEALDCRNYAMAAFKALPVDLDDVARKIYEAQRKRKSGAMTDDAVEQKPKKMAAAAQRRKPRRPAGSSIDRHYDAW